MVCRAFVRQLQPALEELFEGIREALRAARDHILAVEVRGARWWACFSRGSRRQRAAAPRGRRERRSLLSRLSGSDASRYALGAT